MNLLVIGNAMYSGDGSFEYRLNRDFPCLKFPRVSCNLSREIPRRYLDDAKTDSSESLPFHNSKIILANMVRGLIY
jgi:hypothetical protein